MDVATVYGESSFVLYSDEEGYVAKVGVSTGIAFSLVGLVANLYLLVKASASTHSPSTMLLFSVIGADFVVCLSVFLFNSINLAFGGVHKLACLIQGVICVIAVFVSVASLSAAAIERYLCAVRGVYLSDRGVKTWLIVIWSVLSFLLALLPILDGTRYDQVYNLEPSFGTCFIAWSSEDPKVAFLVWILIVFVAIAMIVISICYYLVYKKYKNLNAPRASAISPRNTEKVKREKEKKLLIKCVVLTAVFVTFWIPYLISATYEAITHKMLSAVYIVTAEHFVLFVSVLNPILLMHFDNILFFALSHVNQWRAITVKKVKSLTTGKPSQSRGKSKESKNSAKEVPPVEASIAIDVVSAPPPLSALNFEDIQSQL